MITNNTFTDIFVAPGADDGGGGWIYGGDWHLAAGSPAIDAGHRYMDYIRQPYYNGGRINVGAYGNTREAATTPLPADPDIAGGEPYDMIPGSFTVSELAGAGPPCPGDANGDGTVNILDMVYVRNNLNRNPLSDPGVQAADVNQDGRVNILDMLLVRANFGTVCP